MRVPEFLHPPKLAPALLLSLLVCLWQLSFFLEATPLPTRLAQDPELSRLNLSYWDLAWDDSSQVQTAAGDSNGEYREGTALGLCPDVRVYFLYFYSFDQLPVGAVGVGPQPNPFTDAAARALIAESGSLFRNDFSRPCNTARYGDLGKVFLFWPAAILSGNPFPPPSCPRPRCCSSLVSAPS